MPASLKGRQVLLQHYHHDACVMRRSYGPFWIATTLVFVTAVTGNYASYVSYRHDHSTSTGGDTQAWYYDIDKVTRVSEHFPSQDHKHVSMVRPETHMMGL
jgi:hypothetical protein